jgi:hypothetical protein
LPEEALAMTVERVRWRNVREFLDDLPTVHCTVKPPHEFCTVCMRINYRVAFDCPLFHQKPKRKLRPLHEVEGARHDPVKEALTVDDVKHALSGDDLPIIEFAGPRGSAKKRMEEPEDEIFDVEPIDVTPIEMPEPKAKAKPLKVDKPSNTTSYEEVGDEALAQGAPSKGIDTDELMHRIMEELDIPEDEAEEEEEGKAPEKEKEEAPAGDELEGPEKEKEEAPAGDELEGPEKEREEAPGGDGSPPHVVKKAIVKRKPKGDD